MDCNGLFGRGLASVCTPFPQLEKSQLSESLLPSVEADKDVCLSASVGTKVTLASPVVLGNQELIALKKQGLVTLVLLRQLGQILFSKDGCNNLSHPTRSSTIWS